MIAIHTRYLPATNNKGSRVKAYTASGLSATVPFPYEYSFERCHFQAVKALIKKHNLSWDMDNMRYGDSADGKGYVFCFNDSIVRE